MICPDTKLIKNNLYPHYKGSCLMKTVYLAKQQKSCKKKKKKVEN